MRDEKWNKAPYATHYPALAKLDNYYQKKGKAKCDVRNTCPAAPFNLHIASNVAVNATPTPSIEEKPIILCAEAAKAGNGDPNCKGENRGGGGREGMCVVCVLCVCEYVYV
jgi:hypothetical protein